MKLRRIGVIILLFSYLQNLTADETNRTLLRLVSNRSIKDNAPIHIRINQFGYSPENKKVAIAFCDAPLTNSFLLMKAEKPDASSVRLLPAFHGNATPITNVEWGKFVYFYEWDFSELKEPGRYFLAADHREMGQGNGIYLTIGETVYSELPDQLLEFMREQRCGYNPFLDAVCHPFDGRTAFGPLTNGTYLNCSGGWHDAADQLKYLLTSGNATAQMLLAYWIEQNVSLKNGRGRERQSSIFQDHFNALGQPGKNNLPDILDEARWGLEWMLKLHPAPDQLYHQIADDRDHCGARLPQNEIADYGWGAGSYRVVYCADGKPQGLMEYKSDSTGVANLAGRYAAAMGLAWMIFKETDAAFAERCLKAGKEVYQLGRAKEGVQQGNSYKAPYRYAETTWADDMEWGAATLFLCTSEKSFLADAKRYAKLAASESWMGQEQTGHYQFYPFMNAGHFMLYHSVDAEFKKILAGYYREGIERCLRAGERNPFRIGVPFIWCSNNLTVALVTQILFYERMTGDLRYHEFMSKQRDWLMGRNPWGTSMFTGIPEGGIFPRDPHLVTTRLTKRAVRGGLADGPVYDRIFKTLKGVSIAEPDPLAAFQGEAVYHDDYHDYSSNEPTMDGTASAILMWSLCCY